MRAHPVIENVELTKWDKYNNHYSELQKRVAGLEDDLYSVSGETDYANLSPSPLVPNFPSSQLVPKIYTENQVYFFTRTFAPMSRFIELGLCSHETNLPSKREKSVCWAGIFKRLWSPGIDSKEWIPPAYVCTLACRYDNSIPARFLAPHRLFKNSSSGVHHW